MKKSQTSVEITVILGIMLLILVIFLVINTDSKSIFENKFAKDQTKIALDLIGSKAEFVYAQGAGASILVDVTIPSVVRQGFVENRTLTYFLYSVGDSDSSVAVYKILDFPIQGTLPNISGNYIVKVESFGGYVNVSYS